MPKHIMQRSVFISSVLLVLIPSLLFAPPTPIQALRQLRGLPPAGKCCTGDKGSQFELECSAFHSLCPKTPLGTNLAISVIAEPHSESIHQLGPAVASTEFDIVTDDEIIECKAHSTESLTHNKQIKKILEQATRQKKLLDWIRTIHTKPADMSVVINRKGQLSLNVDTGDDHPAVLLRSNWINATHPDEYLSQWQALLGTLAAIQNHKVYFKEAVSPKLARKLIERNVAYVDQVRRITDHNKVQELVDEFCSLQLDDADPKNELE